MEGLFTIPSSLGGVYIKPGVIPKQKGRLKRNPSSFFQKSIDTESVAVLKKQTSLLWIFEDFALRVKRVRRTRFFLIGKSPEG
jgi:hypothetical protein